MRRSESVGISPVTAVADVKVLGIPREALCEEVAAAIVLKEGAEFDADAAKKAPAGKLANYKIPSYFVTVEKFPLLGSGKIDAITLKKRNNGKAQQAAAAYDRPAAH